jgi:hypothetical protein
MESSASIAGPINVDLIELTLRFPRMLHPGEATHLRGFFGQAFTDEVMLHHHESDGSLRYEYPRVQFKVLDRTAHLIGLAEGVGLVTRLWHEVDHARIGDEVLPVLHASLVRRTERLSESPRPIVYRFRSPWLGLNQANHAKYEADITPMARQALLERILAGNCLSLAKGFKHWVQSRISADCRNLRSVKAGIKGLPLLGFVGTFQVNFHIPDHAGIGKSVSRGFGTVERVVESLGISEGSATC